jgi:hypothetical protein
MTNYRCADVVSYFKYDPAKEIAKLSIPSPVPQSENSRSIGQGIKLNRNM